MGNSDVGITTRSGISHAHWPGTDRGHGCQMNGYRMNSLDVTRIAKSIHSVEAIVMIVNISCMWLTEATITIFHFIVII